MGLLPKPTQNQLFGALHAASARRPECPCKVPDSKRSSTRGILKSYRNHISRFPGNHVISIFKPFKKQTGFLGCSREVGLTNILRSIEDMLGEEPLHTLAERLVTPVVTLCRPHVRVQLPKHHLTYPPKPEQHPSAESLSGLKQAMIPCVWNTLGLEGSDLSGGAS